MIQTAVKKKHKKKIRALVALLAASVLTIGGCAPRGQETMMRSEEKSKVAEAVIKTMSVSDMIYQMMFVTPEAITNVGTVIRAGETTKNALGTYPVGGLVFFANNFENKEQTQKMLANMQSYSAVPLFLGVDEEGGRVARLGQNPAMGTTKHPAMAEVGAEKDVKKAYQIGKTLGKELSHLGFNVNFAPDADVLVNPDNKEIGDRSFGTDPQLVSDMVAQVVCGLQDNGVSATLKHFPGHGATQVDSHTGYSANNRTLEQLRQQEFLPFAVGIRAGAHFVMVSNMTLTQAVDEPSPSSVSAAVVQNMLMQELGFSGIVITDSFSMGAITEELTVSEAVVGAVLAGVDMILMPSDVKEAHDALSEAVKQGIITEERLRQSVRKIIMLKAEKGMFD